MTLEKTAAQTIFPRLNVDKFEEEEKYRADCKKLAEMGVGGFCLFGGNTKNVETTINKLQTYAETPLLICADFEYGLPMRLSDGNEFPHAMAVGKTGDVNNAFKIGKAIAKEAKSIGIRWNLAPVVDVNSNKINPIINIRAYGEDIETVNKYSGEYVRGTHTEKVMSCAKHFPGHGDTDIDSHLEMPAVNKTIEELEKSELIPFYNSINFGIRSVMIGHLYVPAIEKENIPASLSNKAVEYLRNMMKFKGLIITDALDMNSITMRYSPGAASVKAIEAGNNIALMPVDPFDAIESLIEKAKSDENFYSLLKRSVELIVREKRWCGLIPQFAVLEEGSHIFISHQKLALNVAFQGLEVTGDASLLPLSSKMIFAGFAYLQKEDDIRSASRFFTMLAQATENDCDFAFIDERISDENIESYKEGIQDSELVLFPIFIKSRAFHGSLDTGEKLNATIKRIAAGRKTIALLFGSPYVEDKIEADLVIKTFSDSFPSLAAAVVKLSGRESALNL